MKGIGITWEGIEEGKGVPVGVRSSGLVGREVEERRESREGEEVRARIEDGGN
jgi:hypothetical protein